MFGIYIGGTEAKESACQNRRLEMGLIPQLGGSPEEGNGNPVQYSYLENPMDRGAWWATVHGVAKSQTQLSTHTCVHIHTQYGLRRNPQMLAERQVFWEFLWLFSGGCQCSDYVFLCFKRKVALKVFSGWKRLPVFSLAVWTGSLKVGEQYIKLFNNSPASPIQINKQNIWHFYQRQQEKTSHFMLQRSD